ncbi:hypothetical protein ACIBQX_13705 [Nonomuraea sp. NPDC049714]|uniref:hypothetical protein n=1 Tax=Nonomuraea sp. NPDC049714 TaxID=3364357 RepID=UPI0037AD569C
MSSRIIGKVPHPDDFLTDRAHAGALMMPGRLLHHWNTARSSKPSARALTVAASTTRRRDRVGGILHDYSNAA